MRMRNLPLSLLALVLTALLWGCEKAVPFSTELSGDGGLKRGDQVTHDGATIGAVTDLRVEATGKVRIDFAVDNAHATEVRKDSIAAVRADDGAHHLEILTPNFESPAAAPNSVIAGASNRAEEAIELGRGELKGLASKAVDVLQNLNGSLDRLNRSPAWDTFHRDLDDLRHQLATAGTHAHDIVGKQLPRLQSELDALRNQLLQQGKSAEAQQLRKEFDDLAHELGVAPHPTSTPESD